MSPESASAHGVWTHLGGRQFALTALGVVYDIQTGADQGVAKLRALLTLDKTGDAMSGTAKVDVFTPDGTLVVTFPHTIRFTRIKVAALE